MNLNTGGWASPLLRLVARLRSDGLNSATPVTEINGGTISATNADIALVAKGTGATTAHVPDGTATGGNKRGLLATDWQKTRTGPTQIASGIRSTLGGGTGNTASGNQSTVAGGTSNLASGSDSTIGGGSSNTASSSHSFVGCGTSNTASGSFSFIGGGASNTASGQYSTVAGGDTNSATSTVSFVGGGARGTTRGIIGYNVSPSCDTPISGTLGVTQSALLLLGRQTTDATATVLASNNSAATTTNQVILPNNAAYYFRGSVIAGVTAGGNSKAWTFEGAIKRGADAASTAIVGTVILNTIAQDAGASAWTVAITADTTNGGIAVTVTGALATTIRWVCRINTTEMTF
jgi:hypothetical protein